jgi:hypothetical protein
MTDDAIENLWNEWFKDSAIVGNDPYFIKKREFIEEMKTFTDKARIDEIENIMARPHKRTDEDDFYLSDRLEQLKGDK